MSGIQSYFLAGFRAVLRVISGPQTRINVRCKLVSLSTLATKPLRIIMPGANLISRCEIIVAAFIISPTICHTTWCPRSDGRGKGCWGIEGGGPPWSLRPPGAPFPNSHESN